MSQYICNDGNGKVEIEAESAEEAAQAYVDGGDWGDTTATLWVTVYVTALDEEDGESFTVTVDPDEPDCSHKCGHDWQSPYSIVGGCKENPGVHGSGGGVIIVECCMHCGCKQKTDTWAQNPENGEQGLTSVSYEEGAFEDEVEEKKRSTLRRMLSEARETTTITLDNVDVELDWSGDDEDLGQAHHHVASSALDDGIADGPSDGEVFQIAGLKFRLGSHDYETEDGETTCTARIYRDE